MVKLCRAFVLIGILSYAHAQAVSSDDDAATKRTALNYIEGWYEGDAARMESAVHPELAKRMVDKYTSGHSRLNEQSDMTLVQNTKAGYGSSVPKERQHKDITILDRYNNMAAVKIVAFDWVDYLQAVK
jgi:hypothetical protein